MTVLTPKRGPLDCSVIKIVAHRADGSLQEFEVYTQYHARGLIGLREILKYDLFCGETIVIRPQGYGLMGLVAVWDMTEFSYATNIVTFRDFGSREYLLPETLRFRSQEKSFVDCTFYNVRHPKRVTYTRVDNFPDLE